jgi:hypothetical protein
MTTKSETDYASVNDAHDDEDQGTDLPNLIAQLEAILETIETKGGNGIDTRCRCDSDGDIEVTWSRPETSEEAGVRVAEQEKRRRRERDQRNSQRNDKLIQLRNLAKELGVPVDLTTASHSRPLTQDEVNTVVGRRRSNNYGMPSWYR